jgi:hypothetical protein
MCENPMDMFYCIRVDNMEVASFRASTAGYLRFSLLWDVPRRRFLDGYRQFPDNLPVLEGKEGRLFERVSNNL